MKRKKVLLFSFIAIVVLVAGIAVFGGNYLVDYAITRNNDGGTREVSLDTDTTDMTDIESTISENSKLEHRLGEIWHSTVSLESWSIQSDDGLTLTGDFIPAETESDKYVILIHGYHGSRESMYSYGAHYNANEYNVLLIDLRSHGESEGEYIGMGWLDRPDVLKWINKIIAYDSESRIVIHGVSMGGAAALMVSGEENLPGNVAAIVEDCGYTSVWDIFAQELELRFSLPEFPEMYIASFIADMRAGYNFKEASALEQVKKSTTPTLFIHGTADDFVPFDMVNTLYEAAECEKDIYAVEGAGHGEAKNADPIVYFEKVFEFLDKYVSE